MSVFKSFWDVLLGLRWDVSPQLSEPIAAVMPPLQKTITNQPRLLSEFCAWLKAFAVLVRAPNDPRNHYGNQNEENKYPRTESINRLTTC